MSKPRLNPANFHSALDVLLREPTALGTLALAAGAVDDASAWCILALVVASRLATIGRKLPGTTQLLLDITHGIQAYASYGGKGYL